MTALDVVVVGGGFAGLACATAASAAGARVLVAMNANSDAMLVPLSAAFTEQLRAHKARQR